MASTLAKSNNFSGVRVGITPDSRSMVSTSTSRLARGPVCDEAARAPASECPALTATMGLLRLTRRAISANLRGLPKLSTYSRMPSVRGSSPQY